jgi:phosphatidate phosphatase APP1
MKAAMSDFAARIGESVRLARATVKQERELQRQYEEGQASALRQDQRRAAELAEAIWEQVRAAGQASDGAIVVDRNSSSARTTFSMKWQESAPTRTLQIVVDETDGTIQASWVVATDYGRSVDAPRISASDFEVAKLESVILLLIDQRRWAAGALPMIPW